MNALKKNGGFTLVELIVVIAILAILAGVAVPAYSGYITKAKDAAVVSELSAVLTAAQASKASTGGEVKSILITSTGLTIDGGSVSSLAPYYSDDDLSSLKSSLSGTTYKDGAYWTSTSNGWQAGSSIPAT